MKDWFIVDNEATKNDSGKLKIAIKHHYIQTTTQQLSTLNMKQNCSSDCIIQIRETSRCESGEDGIAYIARNHFEKFDSTFAQYNEL